MASQRGAEGGYRLARPASEITVADVIRVVEGPIASVRGERPDDLGYEGTAAPLRDTWIELRTAMRGVLEQTTLADLVERGRGLGASSGPASRTKVSGATLSQATRRRRRERTRALRHDPDDLPVLELELVQPVARQLDEERIAVRRDELRCWHRTRNG